jgi:hypothetical protein
VKLKDFRVDLRILAKDLTYSLVSMLGLGVGLGVLLIALPLTALAIGRYLAAYTEWTPSAFWALAIAPLACVTVAILAGVRQAWIAMTLKPATALRS